MVDDAPSLDLRGQDLLGSLEKELPPVTEFLEADPRPTFMVPIDLSIPLPFAISFGNQAFRETSLEKLILEDSALSGRYRSWCQSTLHWRKEYEFGGTIWAAFKIKNAWKCIRALRLSGEVTDNGISPAYALDDRKQAEDAMRKLEDVKTNDQRLASLYRMMEMSDVGTFEYNLQGTLLRANDSWYKLSLHPGDSHADFSFMDLCYPPDAPLVLSQWNKLVNGNPVTFEMRWKGPNYRPPTETDPGNPDATWVLSACVPVQDTDGNLVSIAGNTIDISAQKRVQDEALRRAEALERARASERRFTTFANRAPIAIYILDAKGQMTYCNNRFFEMMGLTPNEDFRAIEWRSLAYADDQPIVDRQWDRSLRDKERTHAHFRLKLRWDLGDGISRQAWAENQAFPELDGNGNIISIFGTMTDISRFKWAEEILRTRIEEALEAKRKHENFIDMTSHEMRNPLSAVIQCADSTVESLNALHLLTAAENLKFANPQIEQEIKQCVESMNTIISCSLHQKRVIDDILTLSKMDSNLLTIAPVRVEPASVVSEAVHMFDIECKKDNISLSFIEDPSIQAIRAQYVMMDPSRVIQVLINLITNAIKFTRERSLRRIEVSIGASLTPPREGPHSIPYTSVASGTNGLIDRADWGTGQPCFIWVQCSDTGCGLSKEEQGNLFTRFTQATPRTHIRYGGSGLGLFICRKLTEMQGGAIGLQSTAGVGSTFGFFVAARIAPPPTPGPSSEKRRLSLGRVISSTIDTLKPPPPNIPTEPHYTVLIVEDNIVNQKVLSLQLRKAHCTVHVSNHGAEALAFLRTTEYWDPRHHASAPVPLSIILMDIEMPVMDGLTCTRRIRQLQQEGEIVGHIPILAVSANARSEQVAKAKEAGMDDAISKPFRIPELMAKIEALVVGLGAKQGLADAVVAKLDDAPKVAGGKGGMGAIDE